MNIAVIPARGGSKRIPKKNIKDFLGKPIISLVIKKLIDSKVFDKIIVSTDDDDIAKISIKSGVDTIINRPDDLSDDLTTTVPVISHSVSVLNRKGYYPDYVCCVYPCAPLIFATDIVKSLEVIKSSNIDYVYPITEYLHPIQRALSIKDDGGLEFVFPEYELTRTQDLKKTFHDTGQFYWGKSDSWLKNKKLHSNGFGMIIPSWRVVDIDTNDDWIRAEMMYKQLKGD
jgi:pseudaminic acid cytidylyltransferase